MTHKDIKDNPVRCRRSSWTDNPEVLLCVVEYASDLCLLHNDSSHQGSTDIGDIMHKYPGYKYSWQLDKYRADKEVNLRDFALIQLDNTSTDLSFRKPFRIEL